MRAVVQRVSSASVEVAGQLVGRIDRGCVVLVGIERGDGPADRDYITSKVRELRIFEDAQGRMNRSIVDEAGELLVVPQFTLLGDVRKGRRPAFDAAAPPDEARMLFDEVTAHLRAAGLTVAAGVFRAHMQVRLINDGPVTILLDSRRTF